MIRKDLVAAVSDKTRLPRTVVDQVIDQTLREILAAIGRGETVQLLGFGTFAVTERSARLGRNLNTGDRIEIPPRTVPVFRPGNLMKEAAQSAGKSWKKSK